ncbi:SMC-Scp complex subunit ScpB [Candidatus Atelocyanobacterium thalassae]|uniref:Condensin subunit ScpB n=2 Tax=Candidatus Atelocyanobacterium thalassae TaxID=713887 RepID=A0A086CGZ8_9CHRO|nr:SMC-Scp complex subunit ScpB [Candidatus Atelocyanobacterium thalassa]KFF41462.1 MAG: condensin subunit ScpB [Candidatus Atelocyanobacterium thalassa isolate SIO64986]BDA40166.1 segregation and condensation protein B [cyanobacterium endosymbiont of Braarudosphaera bigelowii]
MIRLATRIEAVLYLKGQSLSLVDIAKYLNCKTEVVQDAIIELMSDYAYRDSALEVIETENGYSLQLRPVFNDLTDNIIPAELGKAVLRTLAAIALKNPIVQTELIELRGNSAYQHVQKLVELDFIRKYSKKPGRSYLLSITPKFHQYFEIDQLPKSVN